VTKEKDHPGTLGAPIGEIGERIGEILELNDELLMIHCTSLPMQLAFGGSDKTRLVAISDTVLCWAQRKEEANNGHGKCWN
jgi:hypothetical protein